MDRVEDVVTRRRSPRMDGGYEPKYSLGHERYASTWMTKPREPGRVRRAAGERMKG
jgi:hypothetical protein